MLARYLFGLYWFILSILLFYMIVVKILYISLNLNHLQFIYGLDTEFAPSNFLSKPTIATIQIANVEKVFIFDMIKLITIEDINTDFEQFINAFFVNVSIRIVGYGLTNDWNVLVNTHFAFKNIEDRYYF